MRRNFSYYFLIILLLAGFSSLHAQSYKSPRWVIGSGGVVGARNSNQYHMAGLAGQSAIETIKGTVNGKDMTIHQGFWVPMIARIISVDDNPIVTLTPELVNYPNPFSSSTTIKYDLTGTSYVALRVYDMGGNLVKELISGMVQDAGHQEIAWDGRSASGFELVSGSYIYELTVSPALMSGNPGYEAYKLRNVMVIVK